MTLLNWTLLIAAVIAAGPLVWVSLECLLALAPVQKRGEATSERSESVAVLIPAHDEESVIASTIASIRPQLRAGDRLLVVADNCSDSTVKAARDAGAEVAERVDPERRGKGYALQFGMEHLSERPPGTVIVVDADCRVAPGSVAALHALAQETGRPAQSINLMTGSARMPPRAAVGVLAFLVKNLVRPRGLDRLGLPCLLTGTGMALPWALARDADFGGADLVEDMRLGLDLARRGAPARLCYGAEVTSEFPEERSAGATQRTRWEHGHLRTLLTFAPRLLVDAMRLRSPALFALAIELSVPPLALLVMGEIALLALLAVAGLLGASWAPALLLMVSVGVFGLCIALSWAAFGRDRVPARALAAIPIYMAAKIPLYLAFLRRPERAWVRTARSSASGNGAPGKGATK